MSIKTTWSHDQYQRDVRIELTVATSQREGGARPGCCEVLLHYFGDELAVEIPTDQFRQLVKEAGLT